MVNLETAVFPISYFGVSFENKMFPLAPSHWKIHQIVLRLEGGHFDTILHGLQ